MKRKKRCNKNKKGQLGIYLVFMFVAMIFIVIASFVVPVATKMNSEFYVAGEDILLSANTTISQIQDTNVRTNLQSSMQGALDATESNIEAGNFIFKYGWIIMLIIAGITAMLYSRTIVQYNQGFF